MKKYIVLLILLLLFIVNIKAQRVAISANMNSKQMYEKALEFIAKGESGRGVGLLRMSAGKHYIPALRYLADCFMSGRYVDKNIQEAGNTFEIAAKLGDPESAKILAQLVKTGEYKPISQASSSNGQMVQIVNQYNVMEHSSVQEAPISTPTKEIALADVDANIPITKIDNKNMFAVIIANEHYQDEVNVDFAIHDGEIFRTYCTNTLGIPNENIHFRKDATYNNIKSELDWMEQVANAFDGKAKFIFYYAGHGFPDESSRGSYILPIDGKGNVISTGYSLSNIYDVLGSMPSDEVLVFLDACFSGAQRGSGMLASARGIAIKAKPTSPKGNMIVFSAAKDDETAYPYREKSHGLFTYYLLKELQTTKGQCTLGGLMRSIKSSVVQKSIVTNGKYQTPGVAVANGVKGKWENSKFY